MALERQVIEKKDFPIGRRGYDPDAVDAHLAAVADEVDRIKSTSRRRTETLASAASAQVKAIVEAAESSAAAITAQAEEDAADIRAEASQEAATVRQQASAQARDYVGQVSESTSVMLQRLDAMESELSALLEALRTGSNRLNADLQLLEGNLDEVKTAVAPRPRFEAEPSSFGTRHPRAGAGALGSSSTRATAPILDDDDDEEEEETATAAFAEVPVRARSARTPSAEASSEKTMGSFAVDGDDDIEGARLVALNMALNGTPREETDRYLAENFQLGDRARLLDEVYASVEG
ncbi:DivIVA domain-containing protein [Conexibacter sp. DBS9H8]|uniref:DivIVA domain-containing protein n=1 Tax=Conexibacter sp. DBS9H8 TaxID=2937801 RepID=UPI00201087EC|nr:DivIVA domain-containing protein [Conexibacter sp. DBS9H8]